MRVLFCILPLRVRWCVLPLRVRWCLFPLRVCWCIFPLRVLLGYFPLRVLLSFLPLRVRWCVCLGLSGGFAFCLLSVGQGSGLLIVNFFGGSCFPFSLSSIFCEYVCRGSRHVCIHPCFRSGMGFPPVVFVPACFLWTCDP